MKRCSIRVAVTAVTVLIGTSVNAFPDILFRDNNPLRIGRGTLTSGRIVWTRCDGTDKESFDTPPFSLERVDNCKVAPDTFGLDKCQNGSCVIADEAKLRRYVPQAQRGRRITFVIDRIVVILTYEGATVQLSY